MKLLRVSSYQIWKRPGMENGDLMMSLDSLSQSLTTVTEKVFPYDQFKLCFLWTVITIHCPLTAHLSQEARFVFFKTVFSIFLTRWLKSYLNFFIFSPLPLSSQRSCAAVSHCLTDLPPDSLPELKTMPDAALQVPSRSESFPLIYFRYFCIATRAYCWFKSTSFLLGPRDPFLQSLQPAPTHGAHFHV